MARLLVSTLSLERALATTIWERSQYCACTICHFYVVVKGVDWGNFDNYPSGQFQISRERFQNYAS